MKPAVVGKIQNKLNISDSRPNTTVREVIKGSMKARLQGSQQECNQHLTTETRDG